MSTITHTVICGQRASDIRHKGGIEDALGSTASLMAARRRFGHNRFRAFRIVVLHQIHPSADLVPPPQRRVEWLQIPYAADSLLVHIL